MITAIVAVLAIVGNLANAFKKHWCFYIWSFTNGYFIMHNFRIGDYAQMAFFISAEITTLLGFYGWRKKDGDKNGNT